MMDFALPSLAAGQREAVITRWLKQPGEVVQTGDALVEVETEKVNSELESPFDGVLSEVLAEAGESVAVGRVIARLSPLPTPD
ncbi:MAG TPA: lipoyl domain-containing protein [Candidatus Nitrosotalea sp.]|nr:lipoyl domain-containing protein [Candidatus Nitrosotalea sp.]